MSNKIKLIIISIALVSVLYFAISKISNSSSTVKENKSVREQKLVKVKIGNITDKLKLTGTLAPSRLVDIKSKISGELYKLMYEVGDSIEAGDIIALIKPDPNISLNILKKQLNLWKTKLEFEKSERLHREQLELFKKKLISEDEYLNNKHEFYLRKKEFEASKLDLSIYKRENGLESSSKDILTAQLAKISSTIKGTILQIPVQPGTFIRSALSQYGEGTVICTVGDLSKFIVEFSVSEYDLNKIKINQEVKISLNDNLENDYGVISKISPLGNSSKSPVTFDIIVKFTPDNLKCFPGMSANVDVVLGKKENILTIPIETVLFKKNKGTVVINGPNGPEIKKIIIGITDNHSAEVVSGLKKGMEVFTNPKLMIKNIVRKK